MIRQSSGIASRLQTNVTCAVRSVASQSAQTDTAPVNFVEQRKIYDAQLALLRKGWAKEIQLKKEREAARFIIEREQIVLRQAVRLRQDRITILINKEKQKVKQQTAAVKFAQHLANNEVVRVRRSHAQQMRYSNLVDDLTEESKTWITNDNINIRINEELFSSVATTGLVTRSSQHWKFYAMTFSYNGVSKKNELLPGQSTDRFFRSPPTPVAEAVPNRTSIHRFAEIFMEPMIDSGAERERFSEIVQQVGDTLTYINKNQIYKDEANINDRKSTNWLREKTSTSGDLSAKPRTGRYVDPRGGRRPPRMARTMNRGKYAMDQEREGYTPVPRSAIPRTIQEEEQAMRAISPRSRTAAKRVPRKR